MPIFTLLFSFYCRSSKLTAAFLIFFLSALSVTSQHKGLSDRGSRQALFRAVDKISMGVEGRGEGRWGSGHDMRRLEDWVRGSMAGMHAVNTVLSESTETHEEGKQMDTQCM